MKEEEVMKRRQEQKTKKETRLTLDKEGRGEAERTTLNTRASD
jgi:hypothetical protein